MKKVPILITAVLALASSQVFAQMTRPTFGPDQAKLSFITGRYATSSQITMGENSSTSTGTIKAHWGLDSMFVFISSEEKNEAMGSYRSFGILGYNMRDDEYDLTMFNNFGFRTDFKGNFSGDTLTLSAKIETPRGTFKQKMLWFKEGRNLRQLVYGDFGQGYSLMVDETATPEPGKKMMKK